MPQKCEAIKKKNIKQEARDCQPVYLSWGQSQCQLAIWPLQLTRIKLSES